MTLEEKIQRAIENNDFDELDRLTAEAMELEADEHENSESEASEDEQETEAQANEGEENAAEEEGDGQDSEQQEGEQDATATVEGTEEASQAGESQSLEFDESKISFDADGNAVIPKELLSVVAKDGKHQIPYELLHNSRGKAKELATQLEQEREQRGALEAKLDKQGRAETALKKQLEKNGIDPEALPEDIELSDELLDSLDEYGEVGKVLKALVAKQKTIATTTAPQAGKEQSNASPDNTAQVKEQNDQLRSYLGNNAEFAEVFGLGEGDDRFETMDLFYRQITNDPQFNGKPLSDKLDATMERYHKVYPSSNGTATDSANSINDDQSAVSDTDLAAQAQAKVQEAQESSTPASPSELGNSGGKQKSNLERARSASGAELLQIMEELTPEELEQFQEDCF
ncbi:hypothetical protein VPHD85_0004 [Vibrio phage D85]|nr:hypothetical protein PODOV033v1_p0064 [Vibrio phage 252E42.2]